MADQFDVIEAGERGRRRWIGLVVVLALLAIPAAGLLLSRDDPGPEERPPPSPAPEPIRSLTTLDNSANHLIVRGRTKGGDEVVPVVFPDGARAEVRYPASLELDEMGVRPYWAGWIGGRFRQFVVPYGGEAEITRGGQPIRSYAPNVTLWPRQAGSGFHGQVLLFRFGSWRLAMYDRGEGLTFDQRLALARDLKGRVTKEGYLVLSAEAGVRFTAPGEVVQGQPVGPQLWFGGRGRDMVVLAPTPGCGKRTRAPGAVEGRGRPVAESCRDGMLVAATGSAAFRAAAVSGIRVTMK
ncbi:hypothetical protein [Nonomuraea candida]|uniref:hypothetical protein n=1 Tax=Nonomuraea candida TaxID=359159 RepID=UPI0005B76F58|nr:hypothetical protein [Nonomuraea candida]